MATHRVINSKNECVAEALALQSFVYLKQRCAKEGTGSIALIVTLESGEEIFMEKCKVFRRLPRGASYTARLLKELTSDRRALTRGGVTCGWKREHQPRLASWKLAWRRMCSHVLELARRCCP